MMVKVNTSNRSKALFLNLFRRLQSGEGLTVDIRHNKLLLETAQKLTSYTVYNMYEDYEKPGPYSIVAPHPPIPAYCVNKQTNELYSNWKISRVTSNGKRITRLNNRSEHAAAIYSYNFRAHDNMIKRPLFTKISEIVRKRLNDVEAQKTQKEISNVVKTTLK